MGQSGSVPKSADLLTEHTLDQAYANLASNFDYQNGGFGKPPNSLSP
ncbi:MAG: hypothetical protein CM1200mP35_00550 [Chloroflexota bacterium]|nr:MAG: hypothetical protein CM1200mP35_00550 [Chloroflexota bacterium]